jgi:membrane protein implicated in regulation of membrane protease activity
MIEFIGGMLCLVLGIVGMFLEDAFTIGFFAFCIMSIITALIFNQMKSAKKTNQD